MNGTGRMGNIDQHLPFCCCPLIQSIFKRGEAGEAGVAVAGGEGRVLINSKNDGKTDKEKRKKMAGKGNERQM